MKTAIIDIGSNSVRLALMADGKTLYKRLSTTRLGEGLSLCGRLDGVAIKRTAEAVSSFKEQALSDGADKVFAFATAAVRSAENGNEFLLAAKKISGLEVDVISGETEAKIGITGALGNSDGGIIDIGGASTEVTVQCGGETLYAVSADIGAVRLFDIAGRDEKKLKNTIENALGVFDGFSYDTKMWGVGGTATTLAALKLNLSAYDPEKIQACVFEAEEIEELSYKLLSMPVDEIRRHIPDKKRADIIGGGALLLSMLINKFKIKKLFVSDRDNLEGYYLYCGGRYV